MGYYTGSLRGKEGRWPRVPGWGWGKWMLVAGAVISLLHALSEKPDSVVFGLSDQACWG